MYSVEGVDFRQFFAQLFLIALDKTSDSYQTAFFVAALFDGNLLKENVDGLLLCIADKATGVDDDNVEVIA